MRSHVDWSLLLSDQKSAGENLFFGKNTFQKECTFIKMHKREQFIILKWSYARDIFTKFALHKCA